MKYDIGQISEDGYIYAGELRNHETGEVYGLAVAPSDEPKMMTWDEARMFSIPTLKEGNLISANLGHLFHKDKWYWSPTEYVNTYSWVQRFNDGYQSNVGRNGNYLVRCVRRLPLKPFDASKKQSEVLKELKKQTELLQKIAGVLK